VTFLADTFEKLANDPSWPAEPQEEEKWPIEVYLLVRARVIQARLALMVVNRDHGDKLPNTLLKMVLGEEEITPSHYANVKKRVEEADTENRNRK